MAEPNTSPRACAPRIRGLDVELVPMTTRGDRILDRPLAEIGGKGLFLKELEVAMLEGDAPTPPCIRSRTCRWNSTDRFALAAVLERADAFDAFVSRTLHATSTQLPAGARVGTSSLRRQAQLRARRPDLRGRATCAATSTRAWPSSTAAITTRSSSPARASSGSAVASASAIASTRRSWLPAVAQGAIAVECRDDDARAQELLRGARRMRTRAPASSAERAMNRRLHGSCKVPIAGYCVETEQGLALWGLVGDADSGRLIRAEAHGAAEDPQALGQHVAALLRERGADAMLGISTEGNALQGSSNE